MHLSTTDHKKSTRLRRIFILLWMGGCLLPALGQATSDQVDNPDSIQASAEWKQHQAAAQTALDQASECLSKTLDSAKQTCDPSQFLSKAGAGYEKLATLLAGTQGHVESAELVANGFLRSGLPARAISFLMSRRETGKDPALTHLLADSLFAIGDFPNAGKAYRTWIKTGCGGYLYSLQDKSYWLRPAKGSPCTYLPEALRARLELLKESANGEPRNLPEESDPAVVWPKPWDF